MGKTIYTAKLPLWLIVGMVCLIAACEKVVTLDLKTAGQQLVIQANVTSASEPYTVMLNYSVSYYSNNAFPAVSGAQVQLSDNAGNNEILTETSPGIYKTKSITGVPGKSYYLQIKANNTNYTANSTMPLPVAIDSFLFRPVADRKTGLISGYRAVCKFTDPVGLGNYYRVVINSNDTGALGDRTSRFIADKLSDGQQLSATMGGELQSGDTVAIQVQCIDKNTYDFYTTLNSAIGNANIGQFLSSLPANPTNNISNKGLGYFSAYAVTKQTMIVP